jgi:hypothetical protein
MARFELALRGDMLFFVEFVVVLTVLNIVIVDCSLLFPKSALEFPESMVFTLLLGMKKSY